MADVGRTIDGLGHRADSQDGEHLLLRLALGLLQHLVDRLVDILARALGAHLVAEVGGNVSEILQFVQVRLVMHTIDKGLGGLILGHFTDVLSHLAVGQQHEFLDELIGILSLMDVHSGGLALLIDVKLNFLAVERHRAALLKTATAQLLSHLVEDGQFLGQVTLTRFQDVLGLLIGEAPVAAGDSVANLVFLHLGLSIHLHDNRVGEFVLIGAE